MIYLFIGCVFGGIPMLFRRGGVSEIPYQRYVLGAGGLFMCDMGVSDSHQFVHGG